MTRKGEDRYSLADLSYNYYLISDSIEIVLDTTRKGEDRYSLVDLSSNLSFNMI